MAVFEASVELACSPETVFEFLVQPENIRLITPSSVMLVFDAARSSCRWERGWNSACRPTASSVRPCMT